MWYLWGFPSGSVVNNPPANAGDTGKIFGLGKSPRGACGNPFNIIAWKIPWTGVWWTTTHRAAKSWI